MYKRQHLAATYTSTILHKLSLVEVIIWLCILIQKNSSGDEIANVNICNDDVVHALQNTIDSCMNSATDRHGYVLEHMFTKFSEKRNEMAITPLVKAHMQLSISD